MEGREILEHIFINQLKFEPNINKNLWLSFQHFRFFRFHSGDHHRFLINPLEIQYIYVHCITIRDYSLMIILNIYNCSTIQNTWPRYSFVLKNFAIKNSWWSMITKNPFDICSRLGHYSEFHILLSRLDIILQILNCPSIQITSLRYLIKLPDCSEFVQKPSKLDTVIRSGIILKIINC